MKLKLSLAFLFVTVFSVSTFSQAAPVVRVLPADYKSDGCSLFPDGDYRDCCVEHDKAYYFGGTKAERKSADRQLRACVREKGHKYVAPMMYLGVRIGGVAWLPTPFRWGFGKKSSSEKSGK